MEQKFKLSENDYEYCLKKLNTLMVEYSKTKNELVKSEINHFVSIVNNAEKVDLSDKKENNVCIGDWVSIVFNDDEEVENYQITLDMNNNFNEDKLSIVSPLGRSLYLQEVGSTVEFKVKENIFKVKILSKQAVNTDKVETEERE